MSNLHASVEALCRAVAQRDLDHAKRVALQAACQLAPARAERIRRWFSDGGDAQYRTATPMRLPTNSKWEVVKEPRSPWVPPVVAAEIERWASEAEFGLELAEAGEKVMPILLAGETRCGKTSVMCSVAARFDLSVHRLSLASVVGSHMGETATYMKAALAEAKTAPRAMWLIDEIDGISQKRLGGQGADQERALAIGTLLAELEMLPPGLLLAATTNTAGLMDAAVRARFQVVRFPTWADLDEPARASFALSHGFEASVEGCSSYADVVTRARALRVDRVVAKARARANVDDRGQVALPAVAG